LRRLPLEQHDFETRPYHCTRNSLRGLTERIQVMQHVLSGDLVPAQGEAEAAVGSSQSACPLDEIMTKRGSFIENPAGRPLWRRGPIRRTGVHLQLTVEVVGEHGREEERLWGICEALLRLS
jgi:hypothetical protein